MTKWVQNHAWQIAGLLFLIGAAWATMTGAVHGKLDSARFVADSIRRDATDRIDADRMQRVERKLDALVCHEIPTYLECRP